MTAYPWLASYPPHIAWDTPIAPQPLYTLLDEAAATWPQRVAVDFLGYTLTYRELGDAVEAMAAGLRQMGIGGGIHVGLFLPNCPQFIIAYYAILKTGATVVNFSPLYSTPELAHQIEDSETTVMVTLDLEALYPKLHTLLDDTHLERIIVSRFASVLPPITRCLFSLFKKKDRAAVHWDDARVVAWDDCLHFPIPHSTPLPGGEETIAVLQYTGGTTGTPKGAALTHANLYTNVKQTELWCQGFFEPGNEVMLAVLPFFHVFAMTTVMNFGIASGMTLLLHPRFELHKVLKAIHQRRPTALPGVPTMYAAILNHPKIARYDLSSLKVCISGGAPLPLDTKQQFETKTGCTLVEGYGLTEASPVCAANPLRGKNKAGSIGLPFPNTIFEVVGIERPDKLLADGETGELCIRGPQVMQGYWKKPGETASCLKGGRLHTGDIGYIDEEGYIHIVDRAKEMIITSGFNVYPRNVEEALYLHPAIQEAAVIGVEDKYKGQAVKAFIVCKPGEQVSTEEIRDWCREHLAKYAVPSLVEFRDELPKSMIGKILKKELS